MAFKKSTTINLADPTAIFASLQVIMWQTTLSKELGTLTIDLVSYSAEAEKRCQMLSAH